MTETKAPGGLEGVTAADSAIGKIDGEKGELRYCGYLLKDLAEHSDFLETTWLLWHGELPIKAELEGFQADMLAERELSSSMLALLRLLAPKQEPMDCLRTIVSAMSAEDSTDPADDRQTNLRRGIRLCAKLPTVVAAYARLRAGEEPISPRADLGHAANFLYMLNGEVPSEEEAKMLDVCLVLHAEHGFNASTFAARVTAATLSDMYSAITSAIGTLKGPLHGGANTAVMEMLLEIGDPDGVADYIDGKLDRREKIMGFGHRVYKVVDPRALILEDYSRRLAEAKGEPKWYEMSKAIETRIKDKKGLDMNVDFYSASTYYYMRIEPDLFTCLFAISRVSGWIAHVLEQYANNRLIRPRARWVGPDARAYVAIAERG